MEDVMELATVMVVVPDAERLQFVAACLDADASVISQVKEPSGKTWVVDVAMHGVPLPLRGRKLRPEWLKTHVRLTPLEL